MDIKDTLVTIRKKRGYTKRAVSEMTGIPYTSYIKYESGERKDVSMQALCKLADFYGVTTDYLLGRDNESIDNIDKIDASLQDKAIIRAYVSLPQDDRTKLVEILRKLAEGADLEVTVNDGIQKTVYTTSEPAPMVARSDKPPGPYTSEQDAQLLSEPDHPDKL